MSRAKANLKNPFFKSKTLKVDREIAPEREALAKSQYKGFYKQLHAQRKVNPLYHKAKLEGQTESIYKGKPVAPGTPALDTKQFDVDPSRADRSPTNTGFVDTFREHAKQKEKKSNG